MEKMGIRQRHNNNGLSMVELLIAVAILGILSVSIFAFMNQGSRSYSSTSAELDVQTEAQLTANTITDRIIDCETQIRYYDGHESTTVDSSGNVITTTDSYSVSYVSPSGTTYTVNDHVLQLISANSKIQSVIFWDKDRDVIYYNEAKWNGSSWDAYDEDEAEMLASNVTDFKINTDKLSKNKVLEIELEYTTRGRSYRGSYQAHMRNDVVEGSDATPSAPTGSSVTKVTVNPQQAFIISKRNQALVLPGEFQAYVTGTGFPNSAVTWSMSVDPSVARVEPDPAKVTDTRFGFKQYGITVPDPTTKSFKLIATSTQDTSKSGYATIYIKKVTGVSVNPTSPLKRDDAGNPVTGKNTNVSFMSAVDGWNLTRGETTVSYKLYESVKQMDGSYSAWKEVTDTSRAYISGTNVVIRNNVNSNYRFKLEATSDFDNAVKGEYTFYISDTIITSNLIFARGINMDLKSYYMAYPTEIQSDVLHVTSIDKIEVTAIPDYPGDFNDFISFDSNYVLYIDYDAYHDGDLSRKTRFYQALDIELEVYYTTPTGSEHKTTHITLPAVQLLKAEPASENIVIRKGTSKDLLLNTTGYNIVDSKQFSVFIDDAKVSASGGANLNNYLTCRMITGENGTSILGTRDKAVTQGKFRLTANDGISSYPTASIPIIVAVDDYYVVSNKAANSYIKYNVYVANVEDATWYIPGPGFSGFPSGVGGSFRDYTVTVPVTGTPATKNITVSLKKTSGKYEMKFNSTTYEYDSTYHYWKKKR